MPVLLFPSYMNVILLSKYVKHGTASDFSFSIIIQELIVTYLITKKVHNLHKLFFIKNLILYIECCGLSLKYMDLYFININ